MFNESFAARKPMGRNEGNRRKGDYCKECAKGDKHPNYSGGYINTDGYRVIPTGKGAGITILQHRAVMQEYLGRELFIDENVHHINGIRDDNRIDNLELWSTMQPKGQRITDKVKWAREILGRYT